MEKTGVHEQEYILSLKIDFPQVSIIVSTVSTGSSFLLSEKMKENWSTSQKVSYTS